MRAREELRYTAMIGFDRVRARLLALADQAVAAGTLPEREALWLLEIDEVKRLDAGWKPDGAFFVERHGENERFAAIALPDLFRRFDDVARLNGATHTTNAESRLLKGMGLTRGEASGRAWVLDEPETRLPDNFTPEHTILVARSIDAGWIPTFTLVAGVVVGNGRRSVARLDYPARNRPPSDHQCARRNPTDCDGREVGGASGSGGGGTSGFSGDRGRINHRGRASPAEQPSASA
jgi:hypothetical protein